MLKIPEKGILIAPASLHLPLYQTIHQSQGNTLHLEVYTLNSFIQRFFQGKSYEETFLLFETMKRCQQCSSNNVFYSSKTSYDFIADTLRFVRYLHTYGIAFADLPENTQKEKDLKEILCLLEDLPVQEKQIPMLLKQKIDASNLYILCYEYNETERLWIDFLCAQGATMIEENTKPQIHYWSIANARKQATLIAQTIIEKDYDAQDIFICCEENSQRQVLTQMLEEYQIPYTFLSQDIPSTLCYRFIACLRWIALQDTESLFALINALFPDTKDTVQPILRQFPFLLQNRRSHLPAIYQENLMIDSYRFERLQKQVEQALSWLQEQEEIFSWTLVDIESVLMYLLNLQPCTQDSLRDLQEIEKILQSCLSQIQDPKDLLFLADHIKAGSRSSFASSIQGVLIGKRSEITALRKICFLTNAHAKAFPALSMHSGIYDETYLSSLKVPPLADRLKQQRTHLFHCLSLPETLYILVPEADYDGKENPESHELEQWVGQKPQFQTISDPSNYERPRFVLATDTAKALFLKDNRFMGSISRLESFAKCPLQHFLRYGLYLQEKRETMDIRIQGSIYHHILEKLMDALHKDYTKASFEQVQKLVQNEFTFIRSLYPQQSAFFDRQCIELTHKIIKILEQLDSFEQDWHMQTKEQECKVQMSLDWEQTSIFLYGYIDRVDASQSSFVIFDYKSSDKDLSIQEFDAGLALQLITYTIAYEKTSGLLPAGCYYISLKTSPQMATACKVNYRKKIPEATPLDLQEQSRQAGMAKKFTGLMFQDLSIYSNNDHFAKKKEQPEYQEIKEHWHTILFDLLQDIQSGNIAPDHVKGACDYCAYKEICRNAAKEVIKPSRLEKEENHAL